MESTNRPTRLLMSLLLLALAFANVASTCGFAEPEGEPPAYSDESAEGQMQEEEEDQEERRMDL